MSYKARHAAEPKYITYARSTGASIAAMAVLTAVPAVAAESDAPLGAVGEAAPIAEPAVGAHADTAAADLLDSLAAVAGQNDAAGDADRTPATAPAPSPVGGGVATPAVPMMKNVEVEQGRTTEFDLSDFGTLAAGAQVTFNDTSAITGVRANTTGTTVTVTADADASVGIHHITGTAQHALGPQEVTITVTVTPAPSQDEPSDTTDTIDTTADTTGTASPTAAPETRAVIPLTADLTIGGAETEPLPTLTFPNATDRAFTIDPATLPAGVLTGDFGGNLTLVATPAAQSGNYTITATERAGNIVQPYTITVRVTAASEQESPTRDEYKFAPTYAGQKIQFTQLAQGVIPVQAKPITDTTSTRPFIKGEYKTATVNLDAQPGGITATVDTAGNVVLTASDQARTDGDVFGSVVITYNDNTFDIANFEATYTYVPLNQRTKLTWKTNNTVVQDTAITFGIAGATLGDTPVKVSDVPATHAVGAITGPNGASADPAMVTVNPQTGAITAAPSWTATPGQYTVTVRTTFADGSKIDTPTTFTVTAGKLSDRYTPTVAPAYIGTNPDRVVRSKVNYGKETAPTGVVYTVDDTHNVVEVDADGTVAFRPNPTLNPGDYTATITVHYPTTGGAEADTDVIPVRYSVGDTYQSLNYRLVTDKRTVTRRDSVTIGVPHDADNKPLPGNLTLERGRDWPEWVVLNENGTLTASPDLNVKPGTYVFTSLATFPDNSTGEVTNTIEVSGAYKTQAFKYKRKDGLGAKVGRTIDQALGTEKPGSGDPQKTGQPDQPGEPGQPGQPDTAAAGSEGDTETAGNTDATPTDNMVAAPAVVAANNTAATGTRGATALQTTGADSDGLLGAGAAAGSFALAAAAAFALRRREQDTAL